MFLGLAIGCYPPGPVLEGSQDPTVCNEDFADHTHPLSATDLSAIQKLNITLPHDPEHRTVRVLDPDFYDLHDEWSFFRLLNGETACGATTDPVEQSFASIDAIYDDANDRAAAGREQLLDLEFAADGRLYSPSFYSLSLRTTPRVYAPGTLRPVGDGVAYELAFVDEPSADDVLAILDALDDASEEPIFWRAINGAQDEIARSLSDERVLRSGASL